VERTDLSAFFSWRFGFQVERIAPRCVGLEAGLSVLQASGGLTSPPPQWLLADMKLKSRLTVSSRAKARNGRRTSSPHLPKFSDVVKRLSGIMEGTPDLSSREGFGPTKVSR